MPSTIEKLKKTLEVLQAVPDDRFYMYFWKNHCGTQGCAIGWAWSDRWFNLQGAYLARLSEVSPNGTLYPHFNSKIMFEAVSEFYGITDAQALELFDPDTYQGEDLEESEDPDALNPIPKDLVLSRIQSLIQELEANAQSNT